jgi:hypothetical protein
VPPTVEAGSARQIEITKYSNIVYARPLATGPPIVFWETKIALVMLDLLTIFGFYTTIYIVSARPYSYNAISPAFH